MILLFLRLLAAVALAFVVGKLVSKLKLPSILGWLIAGMILGPHGLSRERHSARCRLVSEHHARFRVCCGPNDRYRTGVA